MTEWRKRCLGEITSFMSKGIPPKYVERENENTVRVLNQKCNRNFEIKYEESRLHDCSKKKVPADKMLQPGDVLINSTGTGTAGRVAQLYGVPTPTTIDGHMILLRPTEEIDSIYYGYAIKAFQPKIETLAEGSTGQTEINRKRLQEEIVISFPKGKETQERIARFLLNIDEKIKVNDKINKNLYAQARAFVSNWKMENAGCYDLVLLSDVAVINPNTYSQKEDWEYINYLDTSSITDGIISEMQRIVPNIEKLPSRARRKIFANDIVFSTVRPNQRHYGIIYTPLPHMLASTGFAVIRSNYSKVCNELLYLCLTENEFITKMQQLAEQSTSTFPSIKPSDLGGCKIPCARGNEADNLTKILKALFTLIATNQSECTFLAELRDSLLPKLMSGEIDISDIDL